MENSHNYRDSNEYKFLYTAGIILRLIGIWILGPILAYAIVGLIYGVGAEDLIEKMSHLTVEDRSFLLLLQGVSQFITFILLPLLYIHYFNKPIYSALIVNKQNLGINFTIAFLILMSAIPLVSWIQDLNKMVDFPDLWNIESKLKAGEASAEKLTKILVYYNTNTEFLIALLVIGIFPAIGEELLFRGVIQNELKGILKNPHVAIWVTGFLFSFLHFQFYGFLPRMLLGVTFGYLYFWSQNILVPMLAHFLNNSLTLIAFNLYQKKSIEINPESADSFSPAIIIFSSIVFIVLLITFKKLGSKHRENASQG